MAIRLLLNKPLDEEYITVLVEINIYVNNVI